MSDPNLMAELKDILDRVHAYHALHKEGCFVFRFVGFKKPDNTSFEECEDCDECGECGGFMDIDESKSTAGMFGNIDIIRTMLNELRDVAEDNKDEEGFVNL